MDPFSTSHNHWSSNLQKERGVPTHPVVCTDGLGRLASGLLSSGSLPKQVPGCSRGQPCKQALVRLRSSEANCLHSCGASLSSVISSTLTLGSLFQLEPQLHRSDWVSLHVAVLLPAHLLRRNADHRQCHDPQRHGCHRKNCRQGEPALGLVGNLDGPRPLCLRPSPEVSRGKVLPSRAGPGCCRGLCPRSVLHGEGGRRGGASVLLSDSGSWITDTFHSSSLQFSSVIKGPLVIILFFNEHERAFEFRRYGLYLNFVFVGFFWIYRVNVITTIEDRERDQKNNFQPQHAQPLVFKYSFPALIWNTYFLSLCNKQNLSLFLSVVVMLWTF